MVVVFQTSVTPFVQQAARAFAETGQLERFYTTIFALPGGRSKHRLVYEIPSDRIAGLAWREWLRLAAGRLDRSGRLADVVWEWAEKAFARDVGTRLQAGLSVVYGYEFGALEAFQRARDLGIKIVYDVPAPESDFVHALLDAELAKFPELTTTHDRFTRPKEPRRTARRRAEWELADTVIAASNFTRDSYARAGLEVAKVNIVPCGAPVPQAREVALARSRGAGQTPLRFIWAGTFSVRKGAHYLLEAWRRGGFGRHARLDIYGSMALPARVISPLPDGVSVYGPIPHAQLLTELGRADALIFPTLCDGFGMVATEAWAQGTPVITTDRAGVFDLAREGESGWQVEAASADSLIEVLDRAIRSPAELRAMRETALGTAARWQWSDYRHALREASR